MVLLVLIGISLVASRSDARDRIIPNGACLLVAVCGLAFQAVRTWMPHALELLVYDAALAYRLPNPLLCVACAAVVLALGVLVELIVRKVRGERGMGMGDVKFVAAWTSALGWWALPGLAAACLFGAVHALAHREKTFAMAPWLTAAYAVTGVALTWVGYVS